MFNVFSFDNYNGLTYHFNKLVESFTNEKIIFNAVLKSNISDLSKVKQICQMIFLSKEEYCYINLGSVIIKTAKLRIIYQTFEKIIVPEISF